MAENGATFYLKVLKGKGNAFLNRFRPVKLIFRNLYYQRKKQNGETVSGPGSTNEQTLNVVPIISSVITGYQVKKMLDIPCGDFNWMKNVDLTDVTYQGADLIDELIRINNQQFQSAHLVFKTLDLLRDDLPQVDLVFCRDCLVHFSYRHIFAALRNITKSSSTYLLMTTFPGCKNEDVVTGDWRMLDFQKSPFHFPPALAIFNEGYYPLSSTVGAKSLGLWKISDLPFK